jgi:hypothetical protein
MEYTDIELLQSFVWFMTGYNFKDEHQFKLVLRSFAYDNPGLTDEQRKVFTYFPFDSERDINRMMAL